MRAFILLLGLSFACAFAPDEANAARARTSNCTRWVAVDASGTGNGQSVASPWTLAQANSPDADGVFICLMSGVYEITGTVGINPDRTLTTPTQRITYQPAPGAVPVLTFATLGSGTNTCVHLAKNFYTVTGLICRGSDSGEETGPPYRVNRGVVIDTGANYGIVTRNAFHFIDDAAVHVEGSGALYNQVTENDISHLGCNHFRGSCATSNNAVGIRLAAGASDTFVMGNRIRDVAGAAIRLENTSGSLSVVGNLVRGNHIANGWLSGIEVEETSSSRPTRYNVIEDNQVVSGSSQTDSTVVGGDHRGIVIRAPSNIVRYNRITASGADGLAVQSSSTWPSAASNRIYDNSVVQSVLAGLSIDHDGGDTGALAANVVMNNSFVANSTAASSPPVGAPPSATQLWIPSITTLGDLVGTVIRNNLLLEDKHDATNPREVFRLDALANCDTIGDQASGCVDANVTITGNVDQGDPADAGAQLTSVATGGCNGYFLNVVDARLFSDGIVQIAGASTDEILIEGDTAPRAITGINLSGNQLSLFQPPVSCTAGAGVSLVYTGTSPTIGAARGE